MNVFDIIHPECQDFCTDTFRKVLSGENVGRIEISFSSRDGRKIVVEGEASCRFIDGKPFNTRGIFRDITDRKAAEEEVARLAALVRFSEDAIIGKNLDGTVTSWNTGAQKIYGYQPEEVIGRDISLLEPKDLSGETHRLLEMVKDGNPIESFETRRVSKEGGEIFVALTISPVRDNFGKLIGASTVGHDITERVHMLEALSESEERFRTITSTVNEAIVLADVTGRITFWNKAAGHIFGYTREEAVGMNIFQSFAPPENRAELMDIFKQFITSGEGFGIGETREYESVRKDGVRIPVELSMSSFSIGGHWHAVGVVRDITVRKKATEALRESEEKFRTIASTANDAIILIDNDGKVAFWNRAAEKMFGYPESEILGEELHMMLAPAEYKEAFKKGFQFFKETGKGGAVGKTVEMNGMKKNKDSFPIELSMSSIKMQGKWQAIGIIRDITDRKKAEEDLRKINTELKGFAHTVSHDLKGPLTAILIAVDTVKELVDKPRSTETGEMLDEVVKILDNNVKNASRLIEDLLSLAEAGQQPVNIYDLDIRNIVDRIIDERKAEIERLGISLEIDDDLGRINGSLAQLYQVFTNLIGNAIKHGNGKKLVITISYLGDDEEGSRRYLVKDNGKGIPEGDLKNIFLPFFMGEGGGTGIGLSTVQKIVNLYGGSIRAYNDNGACFEFTLKDLPGLPEEK
ncbi:MAG: PAS domain S-box protein [Actinobacteria bacterium]|nr:PAS domain S-box protein [Actinomycetota bacterium]